MVISNLWQLITNNRYLLFELQMVLILNLNEKFNLQKRHKSIYVYLFHVLMLGVDVRCL